MSDIYEVVSAWKNYAETIDDWRKLVKDIEPKQTGCGPVYELKNPIERPNESFAIADMRNIKVAEPHYHTNGETEIYIMLQGSGITIVGGTEQKISKGSVVVTPPETAHYTIPNDDLIILVVNTPPFKTENAVFLHDTNKRVGFDKKQFERLTK